MKKFFFKFPNVQKKRIKKNFFSKLNSEFLQIAMQFIYPPLMMLIWGVENFGIWIFFTSIPNILLIFNLNYNTSVTQEMTIFYSKGNEKKVEQIYQNGIALTILNISIFVLIGLCFYFFFSIFHKTGLDISILKNLSKHEVNTIILLIFLSSLINIFNSVFVSGIYFQGKQFIVTNISYIFELILKITTILLGLLFKNLIYIAIILFVLTICKSFIYSYYCSKHNKYLRLSLKKVSSKIFFKLFKLSIGYSFETINNLIKHHGLIVLIGIFFNAQMVAYINTAKTLFYFFPFRFFNLLQAISIFEYAYLFGKKKFFEIKNYHTKHIFLILLLLSIFIISSFIIGPAFYGFWLNHRFDISYIFLLLLVLDASTQVLNNTITIVMKSLNIFFKVNLIETLFVVVSTFISYYLLSIDYSYLSYFIIMLIASSLTLVFSIYIYYHFHKEKLN